ncbi:MAG TPA: hypothetical protein VHW06_07210 [Streptosporangiaceae bacterium]|nr:hypothetical protein [Streptosporangiaceae bacterium]
MDTSRYLDSLASDFALLRAAATAAGLAMQLGDFPGEQDWPPARSPGERSARCAPGRTTSRSRPGPAETCTRRWAAIPRGRTTSAGFSSPPPSHRPANGSVDGAARESLAGRRLMPQRARRSPPVHVSSLPSGP